MLAGWNSAFSTAARRGGLLFSSSKWKKEKKRLERTARDERPAAMVTHPDWFVPPMTVWFLVESCSMLEGKFLLICMVLVPGTY